jgi:flagellin-like hook-associated protein FlgL
MTSIEEVKLHLAAALSDTEQSALAMAGVVDRLDQAVARLRLVTMGSVHPKVEETVNRLEQAKSLVQQAQSVVRGAANAADEYRSTI